MLKQAIKRMKPAEIAEVECRDVSLFEFGSDYEYYCQHWEGEVKAPVKIVVRVYNFTEGKNCFNMDTDEKALEARRKKTIGVEHLKKGRIDKALAVFETIVGYFGSGEIDQEGYNEKVSALMNSILCHMRLENYPKVLELSEAVLEPAKHGYDINNLEIKGPENAKIEGKVPEGGSGSVRREAGLEQNAIILDKCRYRRAVALVKMGEASAAVECLGRVQQKGEEVTALLEEALKKDKDYQKKKAKMYKNMFG